MKTKFDISAAMIVKNEEKNIGKAINSLRDSFANIIVVDTGSSDKTAFIAAKHGANVFYHSWEDDFSAARNQAIAYVNSSWVLSLDADEELDFESFADNQIHLSNNKIGGLSVIIKNYLDQNLTNYTTHRATRIFRKHRSIKYHGKIHEQISDSIIDSGLEIIETDILILHYGYINSSEEKKLRNKNLLQEEANTNPSDDYITFHLANTEFSMMNLEKARDLFKSVAYSRNLSEDQLEIARLRLAQIGLKFEDKKLISEFGFHPFNNMDREGLRLSILAAYQLGQGNFELAKELYSNPIIMNSAMVDKTIIEKAIVLLRNI